MSGRRLHYFVFALWVIALAATPLWASNYLVRLAIMIAMFTATALLLRRTLDSIATPCSVNTYGA